MSLPVVCGDDEAGTSVAVLEEALRRAAERGTEVLLLRAFRPPERWATWALAAAVGLELPPSHQVAARLRSRMRRVVAEVRLRMAVDLDPVPQVVIRAQPGRPVDVLTDAAAEAAELVVGHAGAGVPSAPGSVALGCLVQAPCPVTVVPVGPGPREGRTALLPEEAAARAPAP